MFVELFPNVGLSEEIWPSRAFPVSMIPADLYPDKIMFFPFSLPSLPTIPSLARHAWYREFGAKIMEIKVVEINVPLNQ